MFALWQQVVVAQSGRCDDWGATKRRLADLKRYANCGPEYSHEECSSNLGLGLAIGGAVAGGTMKRDKKHIPKDFPAEIKSCGLIQSNNIDPHSNVLWALLGVRQVHANSCVLRRETKGISAELNKLIEAQKADIEKEVQKINAKLKQGALREAMVQNKPLLNYQEDAWRYMIEGLAEPDKEKAAKLLARSKLAHEVAEQYLRRAPEAQRTILRTMSEAVRLTYMTKDPIAANKYWLSHAPDFSDASEDVKRLRARNQRLGSIQWELKHFGHDIKSVAMGIEKSAGMMFDQASRRELATLRLKALQAAPQVPIKSSLLRQYIRFDMRAGGKVVAKVVGAAAGGTFTVAAMAATEVASIPTLAAGTVSSEYLNLKEDGLPVNHMDGDFKKFLALPEEAQKQEWTKVQNLQAAICQYHKKYFDSNIRVSCESDQKIVIRNNSSSATETMYFDKSGYPSEHVWEVGQGQDYWHKQRFVMTREGVKEVQLIGRQGQMNIPAVDLDKEGIHPGYRNEDSFDRMLATRVRSFEFRACCKGDLDASDERCSGVSKGSSGSQPGLGQSGSR